jgi:hypothetical protein
VQPIEKGIFVMKREIFFEHFGFPWQASPCGWDNGRVTGASEGRFRVSPQV